VERRYRSRKFDLMIWGALMFRTARLLVGLLALAALPARAGSFTTLHTFTSGDDGAHPTGGMTLGKGQIYGTTTEGGPDNLGTIFQLDPATGDVTILYAFQGGDDGANPDAAPTYHKGILYGTDRAGGEGFGAVYAFNLKTGEMTSLHVFTDGEDGGNPVGSLRLKSNVLYGTAAIGAAKGCINDDGCGTVFQIDLASGEFATLYAFPNDETQGGNPVGGLQLQSGALLGTAFTGGINTDGQVADGTLFALDPTTGDITNLHVFDGLDGSGPLGNMLYRKGTLYGAASLAGTGCTGGCGTLFSYDFNGGGFAVLHQFTGTDGRDPKGGLIFRKGMIYGTTLGGGTGCSNECGTVFSLNPATGALTTLYNFTGGADGEQPWGGLVYYKRTFYGTTELGGDGYGTIFALKP
jgi:uncharacterized repeat protein (TIGR03803 family)